MIVHIVVGEYGTENSEDMHGCEYRATMRIDGAVHLVHCSNDIRQCSDAVGRALDDYVHSLPEYTRPSGVRSLR